MSARNTSWHSTGTFLQKPSKLHLWTSSSRGLWYQTCSPSKFKESPKRDHLVLFEKALPDVAEFLSQSLIS